MTDKQPRRSSGGMYDPARDSWGDRSGERDEPPRPQRDAQPLGDRAGVDSPAAAAAQEVRLASPLCRMRVASDGCRSPTPVYLA